MEPVTHGRGPFFKVDLRQLPGDPPGRVERSPRHAPVPPAGRHAPAESAGT